MIPVSIAIAGCGQAPADEGQVTVPANAEAAVPAPAPASRPAAVVPLPADQAQLDRMILAGYTPHAGHLHPPGVNECPLAKGTETVM